MRRNGERTCTKNQNQNQVGSLSELEQSILGLLMEGGSISDITRQTGYSEHSVAIVLDVIRRKTGANSLVRALLLLLKSGAVKL